MKLYKFELGHHEVISIGDWLDVDDEPCDVKVISIVKVDMKTRTIWFNGVLVRELN